MKKSTGRSYVNLDLGKVIHSNVDALISAMVVIDILDQVSAARSRKPVQWHLVNELLGGVLVEYGISRRDIESMFFERSAEVIQATRLADA